VISDSLEAPGPAGRLDAAARALRAGVDVLLYTSEADGLAASRRLVAAVEGGRVGTAVLERANRRIARLKTWLAGSRGP
jgi:beta-glucosidase-like glycosyl hydrolase